jgi:hypothetical protein
VARVGYSPSHRPPPGLRAEARAPGLADTGEAGARSGAATAAGVCRCGAERVDPRLERFPHIRATPAAFLRPANRSARIPPGRRAGGAGWCVPGLGRPARFRCVAGLLAFVAWPACSLSLRGRPARSRCVAGLLGLVAWPACSLSLRGQGAKCEGVGRGVPAGAKVRSEWRRREIRRGRGGRTRV